MQPTLRLIGELGRATNAKDWELLERTMRKACRKLKTGKWGWRMEPQMSDHKEEKETSYKTICQAGRGSPTLKCNKLGSSRARSSACTREDPLENQKHGARQDKDLTNIRGGLHQLLFLLHQGVVADSWTVHPGIWTFCNQHRLTNFQIPSISFTISFPYFSVCFNWSVLCVNLRAIKL